MDSGGQCGQWLVCDCFGIRKDVEKEKCMNRVKRCGKNYLIGKKPWLKYFESDFVLTNATSTE